jgi:hypothetical protein
MSFLSPWYVHANVKSWWNKTVIILSSHIFIACFYLKIWQLKFWNQLKFVSVFVYSYIVKTKYTSYWNLKWSVVERVETVIPYFTFIVYMLLLKSLLILTREYKEKWTCPTFNPDKIIVWKFQNRHGLRSKLFRPWSHSDHDETQTMIRLRPWSGLDHDEAQTMIRLRPWSGSDHDQA